MLGYGGLPPSWSEAKLGDILPLAYGKGLVKKDRVEIGPFPVFGSAGIVGSHTQALIPGPALIVGRKGTVGATHYSPGPCWPIDTTYFIKATPSCHLPFFGYLLRTTDLASLDKSTAIPGLNRDDYSEVVVPLPPLPEQHRIVAEIEKQLTRLDVSVAALKRAKANLRRYRASVLKAACEGTLAPTEAELARAEGRDYEPASILLERILAERRARWESQEKKRGKYKEPVSPDTSELPELPEGWVWASLDQAVTSLEGGNAATATNDSSSRRVLRSSAVRHGSIDMEDYRYLSSEAPQGPDPYLTAGDLLFTRLSGTLDYVGNCAVVGELFGERIEFPDRIFRGRCARIISPHFVQFCFAEKTLRQPLESKAKSTAGHQRISLSDLREYRFPLPPLSEQHRIVAEVERRLSVIQQSEAAVEASLARVERMRQSILKQAFFGKLVPQDPNDEPASVLLERIKAEREAAKEAEAAKPRARRPRVASSKRSKAAKER